MFKNIASGAILALLACTLVVHGSEKTIQDVLDERYKQFASELPEFGSLAAVASKDPVLEATSSEGQELAPETTTAHCKCQEASGILTRAEPESGKPAKKPKQDKTKACKIESAASGNIAQAAPEEVSAPQACEKTPVAVVEEGQFVQEQAASEEEAVTEEPVEKKGVQKEKNKVKSKNKKRDKRDTKSGRAKSKSGSKSKSKRSSEGKSKSKDKKSRK